MILPGELPPMHNETEHDGWTINIGDHPARKDSALYGRSRRHMITAVEAAQPWYFGGPPYQDHHGGGCWVYDNGPILVMLPAGIEWSAQFCADPVKVDRLRQIAKRVVNGFPATERWYTSVLGMEGRDLQLLYTAITDAAGVSAWTDSFWNASVPLPASLHTGTLPKGAGYHHYPKPIVDILTFKRDDFPLFVTSPITGNIVAVVPVEPYGSGNGAVKVLWSPVEPELEETVLPEQHHLARAAFAAQSGETVTTTRPPESSGDYTFPSSNIGARNLSVSGSDPAPVAPPQTPPLPLIAPPWTTVSFWISVLGTLSGLVVAVLASSGKHITVPDSIISAAALLFSTVLGSVYTVQAASTARHVAGLRTMTMARELGTEDGAYLIHTLKGAPYHG